MNIKVNQYPAELLVRLYGLKGKQLHPSEQAMVADLIKDYYLQIDNLQQRVITLEHEKGQLKAENIFLVEQMQDNQ